MVSFNIKKRFRLFAKMMLALVFVSSLISLCFLNVAAATGIEEKGYIEYQTEASINFTEVVEVTLTDKTTGHYLVHSLYRINDYSANMSVPMGEYTVSAKIISDTGADVYGYGVTYLGEDIVVNDPQLAVPVKLRVDIAMPVETSPDDYASSADTSLNTTPSGSDTTVGINNDEVISSAGEDVQTKGDSATSLWLSSLFYFSLLVLLVVIYWLYKRRLNKNDKD